MPQLHLHHVARLTTDAAWPAPVWGRGEAVPYADDAWKAVCAPVLVGLAPLLDPSSTTGF